MKKNSYITLSSCYVIYYYFHFIICSHILSPIHERRSPQTPIYQLFIIIHILHDHSSLQKQFHTSTNRMRRSRNLLLSTNKLLIHTNTSQQIRNKSYNNKPNRRHSFTNKNHNYHKKIWKNVNNDK